MSTGRSKPIRLVRVIQPEVLRVCRANLAREKANREFRAAILSANRAGVSLRVIGEAAGVSHVRVLQIVQDQRSGQ